jgi:dihydrofolate synthase/folylpolyglutamate synthase
MKSQALPFKNYHEAVKFISRLHRAKPGVSAVRADRMSYMLSQMGQPEKKLKVVHVTGTSGKGSTAAILSSILRAAGYRVGTHVSPHLQSVRERTQINGKYVTKAQYFEAANRTKRAFDRTVAKGSYGAPDYFQFLTAISLNIFVKKKIDIAVIEVGAGGYGDSTNVIIPVVSVITNIGLDHIGALGNTLAEIASVKAGIIKPQTIVISGVTQVKPAQVIANRAKELKCRLIIGKSASYKIKKVMPSYIVADIITKRFKGYNLKIGLTGAYQVQNAVMAILATNALAKRGGFKKISDSAVKKGLEEVRIPGRFEIVQEKPIVVLDSAHNPDKMNSFVKLVKKLFKGAKVYLVIGFKKSKDYDEMMIILNKLAPKKVFITEFASKSLKPLDATVALGSARTYFKKPTVLAINFDSKKAVKEAMAVAGQDGIVIVTGSMYLVGEVRHIWERIE